MRIDTMLLRTCTMVCLACLPITMIGGAKFARADVAISPARLVVQIDFEKDLPGVNRGAFAGAGLSPMPDTGQLDSGAWCIKGLGREIPFGGITSEGVFAQGELNVAEGAREHGDGVYALTDGANRMLAIRTRHKRTPCSVTLRIRNETSRTLRHWKIAFSEHHFPRPSNVHPLVLSYSLDDVIYTEVPASLTTELLSEISSAHTSSTRYPQRVQFVAAVAAGQPLFVRWTSYAPASWRPSSGPPSPESRDVLGLDDIRVEALQSSNETMRRSRIASLMALAAAGGLTTLFFACRSLGATA